MTAREVIKLPEADGWYIARKGPGAHLQFPHATKPGTVTVSNHPGDVPIGTLKSIEKQSGIRLRK